ncbi:unnamed protein product [Lota lota]
MREALTPSGGGACLRLPEVNPHVEGETDQSEEPSKGPRSQLLKSYDLGFPSLHLNSQSISPRVPSAPQGAPRNQLDVASAAACPMEWLESRLAH